MKRDELLDLNDAIQHPGRKIAVDISTELPDEADLDLAKPLEGWIEAVSTGNLLLIEGEFKTRCVLECPRCGAPIEQDVDFTMDEQFPITGTPAMYGTGEFAKIEPDEPYELFHENSLIVENLVREGLIINLPVQPLCEHGWEEPCPEAEARQVAAKEEKRGLLADHLEALLRKEQADGS